MDTETFIIVVIVSVVVSLLTNMAVDAWLRGRR